MISQAGRWAVTSIGTHRVFGIVFAAFACVLVLPIDSASAQGFFETLFGSFRRPAPHATSFADPLVLFGNGTGRTSNDFAGGGVAYCVRTCDGRFFPLQRDASASPAEVCKSFCASAETAVFRGSKIDTAVASNGARYSDLDNAFVYRKRIVNNCTCNGKDAFGLARLNVVSDPTLRHGDIVATNDGLTTYTGGKNSKFVEFTPLTPSSIAWSRRLAETKVTPQPEPEKVMPVANDSSRSDRRRAVQFVK
jgi:hypothetical protein